MKKNEEKAFILLIILMSSYVKNKKINNSFSANDYLEQCNGVLMCMSSLGLITDKECEKAYDTLLNYK